MISNEGYNKIKEASVTGRYIAQNHLASFFETFKAEIVGESVAGRPIHCLTLGSGKHKIMMWSQMHGNESTTTKAVLDLVNYLSEGDGVSILENCTLKIIPMLNPDGAQAYTRFNANKVDLNRDAQARTQPESKVLRQLFDTFKPHFCFNLHDQRTIYNVGKTNMPATISFLAPAHDVNRTISESRSTSMRLIVAMHQSLQKVLPGQVARYDDAFNENCVGDTFQMLNTPTILFEAGHYTHDYARETTRIYIFHALVLALDCIAKERVEEFEQEDYFSIPENQKLFFDVLVLNAYLINSNYDEDVGVLFVEVLRDGKVYFEPKVEKAGSLSGFYGHETYDCSKLEDINRLKRTSTWNLLSPDFK